MEDKRYVLDANVFLEYIFGRKLQSIAKGLISQPIMGENELIIPSLALDEISEVLCGNMNDADRVAIHLNYLEELISERVLKVMVPTTKVRIHAIKMARQGNKKSGYPEFSDCLYHSLALFSDAVFITNDKKHLAKMGNIGHIQLLSNIGVH